ncbi:MAG: hypothetical protein CVU50_06905 [Candidatus Cloacimonetes bacterium HGW-Cloacimonetes-3]|jgi:hypothetical protein|nr:MAG: hypothetical protein CVU50_06905 [Candidatus Cloacimonetes bacterium HGW-Cloacimonetes-3]
MRVTFINGVKAYSGKLGEMVFYNHYNYLLCQVRQFTYPTLGENHLKMKDIFLHLNELYLEANADFRDDLKTYALYNSRENVSRIPSLRHKMPNAKTLFTQCMWKWAKEHPESVDLKTVTLTDMLAIDSPVCRVCTCVNAGYIKKVTGWERLDKIISTP